MQNTLCLSTHCANGIMAASSDPTLLSVEMKRARDRRAQRNFRRRKNDHIANLEEELSVCREQVARYLARIRDLEFTCSDLHEQNVRLLGNHPCDGIAVCSGPMGGGQCPTRVFQSPPPIRPRAIRHTPQVTKTTLFSNSNDQSSVDETDHAFLSATHTSPHDTIAPRWSLTPPQGCFMWDTLSTHSPWGGDMRVVLESPDLPSPLELLYGSRKNRLANAIHDNTRVWRCREPERLAGGWLAYVLSKWMAEPTEARYERLPEFLRPEPEQLRIPHPVCIDGIVFPQLRTNLISKPHLYHLDAVLDMISCCLKVRWPWGKNFLTPSDGADLCILPEFYNTFMSLDGWGLTEEFIIEYPVLMEGLDIPNVCYKMV